MEKKKILFLVSIAVIAVISISFLIPVEAVLKNFTFTGVGNTEGFIFKDVNPGDPGTFTGSHDNTRGNGVGSLLTDYTRGGGNPAAAVRDALWERQSTWEDLGVPVGNRIDGLDGNLIIEYLYQLVVPLGR